MSGIDAQDPIEGVLYMSGERPATSFSNDGGTRARALEFWGSPYPGPDAADVVNQMNGCVRQHFGHAGPAFIEFLLRQQHDWEA